ncbi:MAG: hypothetical protein IJ980_00185, partial [Oscillospiraceae bacterium]|nr:hypothetical protein [Oscillospiraceae bacterium]
MLSLRAARVNAGYTQKRAAELVGVNAVSFFKGPSFMKKIYISENITDLRKKRGITQKQLAS